MKILRWIGYASTIVGVVLMIWAIIIAEFFKSCPPGSMMHHPMNLFGAANSFLLLAIALFILTKHCCGDGCCKGEAEKQEDIK